MFGLEAVVGRWFQGTDRQVFEVVAVDEDADTIEIQYVGGDIGEIEIDVWRQLTLISVPPPDDWIGTYSELDYDSMQASETGSASPAWDAQLAALDGED